jgi:hypothetical protein
MAPSRSMAAPSVAAPSVGPDRRKLIFIGMRVEVSRHTQKHLLRRLPRTGGTLRAETAGKKTVPARVHARARNLRCHRRCRCGMGEGPGHGVALDGGIEVGPDRRELVPHRHGHLATYWSLGGHSPSKSGAKFGKIARRCGWSWQIMTAARRRNGTRRRRNKSRNFASKPPTEFGTHFKSFCG